jgi:nickel/cobalt transporter regulator
MRRLLISILLASAAASPALAQDRGDHHDRGDRAERSQAREEHQQAREEHQQAREERSQAREQVRSERSGGGGIQARQQQDDRAAQFQVRQQAFERANRPDATPRADRGDQRSVDRSRQRGDGVSRWNRDNVQQAGETSRWTRDPNQRAGETSRWTRDRTGADTAQRSGSWSRDRGSWSGNRDGDYRQNRGDRTQSRSRWENGGWNRDWRNDRRYDWRSYRDRHRSAFHIGVYFDPFGYSYRPFDIGYRLQPLYLGQRYWIDAGMYQLPYPPPGTQWVRYWNDAVLVDMYSGEVVDVIRNFFW